MASLTQISSGKSSSVTTGPLKSLFASSQVTVLNYPADLGTKSKNHYVKFNIKQIDTSEFITESNNGTISSKALQAFSQHSFKSPTQTMSAYIALYMPDTLTATYNAAYSELSLTNDLGSGAAALQYVQAVAGGDDTGSVLSKDAAILSAITKGIAAASKGVVNNTVADVALTSKGIAINPQIQMIFSGVGLRSFQLTFIFTPSSINEAQTVAGIINTFKYHFSPNILSGENSSNGLFYIPPSYFNLEFMFGAKENQYLPKYGDCVLESIDVNYAPNGFAAHVDGAPVQTQLNLSFKELEIITKDKILLGQLKAEGGLR